MKYVGSKARLVPFILPIILRDRQPEQWYVEPFAGGMNSICAVDNPRLANDISPYLIELFQALVDGYDPPGNISEEEYKRVRDNKTLYPKHYVGYVGYGAYAGKWFGGYPRASKRNMYQEHRQNILYQAPRLKGTVFSCNHYYGLDIPPNSIVYCDPPYEGSTGYNTTFHHKSFWSWVRQLVANNHKVFISEYNAPPDFIPVWKSRLVSSLTKDTGSKSAIEKLFIHESQT